MAGLEYVPDRPLVEDLCYLERLEERLDALDEIAEERAERRRQEDW